MKNCICSLMIVFVLLFFVQDISAQKTFLLGIQVNGGIANESYEWDRAEFLNFTAYLGYYINQQTVLGFGSGFQVESNIRYYTSTSPISLMEEPSERKFETIGTIFKGFVRRYATKEKQLGFYGEWGIEFNPSKYYETTTLGLREEIKTESIVYVWETYIGPGIELPLGEKWQINAMWGSLFYRNMNHKDEEISSQQFRLDLRLNTLKFNLNYLF